MASIWNRGLKFSIFGESHGKAIGVVVDCVPEGLNLNFEKIKNFMKRRTQLNFNLGCGSRFETDEFEILSGIFNGKTTGSPICAVIFNKNFNSDSYEKFKNFLRPGHTDYGANLRYKGFNDFRGSGHLSGRLTAPLVFVGALCEQFLLKKKIQSFAHVGSVGKVFDVSFLNNEFDSFNLQKLKQNKIPVINEKVVPEIENEIEKHRLKGDSIGGTIECVILGLEAGIGSPIFDRIENYLADLVFAVPAVRAIEFGAGFDVAKMTGFENNDEFFIENGVIKTRTNNCGGLIGGISTGMPVVFRAAIKPTPTIFREQKTVDFKHMTEVKVNFEGRHDSCVVLRAVVVIEAVANIAIMSQLLNQGFFKN